MVVGTDEAVKVVQLYSEQLKTVMSVDQVWVFGSRIRGNATEESDVDVAVFSAEYDSDYWNAVTKAYRVFDRWICPYDLEIHGFGLNGNSPMIDEIKHTGIRVV